MSTIEATRRPREHDHAVREVACRAILPDVMAWLREEGDDSSEESVLSDLVLCAEWDAYRFATDLERRKYWSPDYGLVEVLAAYSPYYATQEAVRKWVADNNVTIKQQVGDRGVYRGKEGVVREVRPDTASVIFVPDVDVARYAGGGGLVVPTEELAAALEPQP